MDKKVLIVGWHPSAVNYAKYPGPTPERLEAGLRADETRLADLGYQATLAFIRSAETAVSDLTAMLEGEVCDVVMIGAGVRRDDEHFLVFEQLVNAVHTHAPQARIAFNTGLTDSAAAVQRWARYGRRDDADGGRLPNGAPFHARRPRCPRGAPHRRSRLPLRRSAPARPSPFAADRLGVGRAMTPRIAGHGGAG